MKRLFVFLAALLGLFVLGARGQYSTGQQLPMTHMSGLLNLAETIPLPGDVSLDQMERIYSDVASLATKWNKPLSARLQPIPGKKAGDRTEFSDPYLFNTTLHALP